MISNVAERFADRVRARRRHRVAMMIAASAVCIVVLWVITWSPLLQVRQVEIRGTQRVSSAAVNQVLEQHVGEPMVFVDTDQISQSLGGMELVRSASVTRHWPGTLVVEVRERVALAAVTWDRGGVQLVDDQGVVVDTVPSKPSALPLLKVNVDKAGEATRTDVLQVYQQLPDSIRTSVTSLGGSSPDALWFNLRGGVHVVWGSRDETPEKIAAFNAVQQATRGKGLKTYDVSASSAPAVR